MLIHVLIKEGKPIRKTSEIQERFDRDKNELLALSANIFPPTGKEKRKLIKDAKNKRKGRINSMEES